MVEIIAITNQKGGVGKTTSAINISTALAAIGKRTLLVDLDPQGNASTGVGIELRDRKKSIYEALVGRENIRSVIREVYIKNLYLCQSKVDLAAAEIELFALKDKELILKNILHEVKDEFDFIIIDCPPSLSILTINALTAAKYVMIPLQCEFFALEGLVHLTNTINLIKRSLNSGLEVLGILLTMVDRRNKLSSQVDGDVRSTFGDMVFKSVIPRNVKISEAPSHGQPALIYDSKCIGSIAYMMLAKEILDKLNMEITNDNAEQQQQKRAG